MRFAILGNRHGHVLGMAKQVMAHPCRPMEEDRPKTRRAQRGSAWWKKVTRGRIQRSASGDSSVTSRDGRRPPASRRATGSASVRERISPFGTVIDCLSWFTCRFLQYRYSDNIFTII